MSEKLIAAIIEITKEFHDPISKKPFDEENSDFKIVCSNGKANITIVINDKNIDKYEQLSLEIKRSLEKIQELSSVNIVFTAEVKNEGKSKFQINATNIIAVASGKGGVGKSTFAVNLAVALNKIGNKVGILDADIYGPSVPKMMGLSEKPKTNDHKKLIPLIKYEIKCMSIGFLIDEKTPAIWRGPMIMKALEQMFNGVEWGDLDYLIIDLPPGTGDAQITLAQSSKLSGAIIISTPQDIALIDAIKAINMFRKVNVPVLGIVENMSYFICDNCKEKHEIFSSGGAIKEAEKSGIDFLGELPINIDLRKQSDEGRPVCISDPENLIAKKYIKIAEKINSI